MTQQKSAPIKQLACAEIMGGNHDVATAIWLPGLSGFLYSKPCGGAKGGDVHYVTSCFHGVISRVCLADVAGHGEQVSRISAWLHDLLRNKFHHHNPAHTFESLNRRMAKRGFDTVATAFCLSYDSAGGGLAVCNAGHPAGLMWASETGGWSYLNQREEPSDDGAVHNLILGVMESARYGLLKRRLKGGERFLIYSDGVIETPAPDGTLFGEDNLMAVLNAHTGASDEALVEEVLAALARHSGSEELAHDDVTLIALTAEPLPQENYAANVAKKMWARWRDLLTSPALQRTGERDAGDIS